MSDVAIDPASPESGRLDRCDPPLQGLGASGTPRDMSQSARGAAVTFSE